MRHTVRLVRTCAIPTEYLKGAVGARLEAKEAEVLAQIKDQFGPLAPRVRFFVPEAGPSLATIEVMSFDIKATGVPFAGLVNSDPIDTAEIHRVDGALQSELNRMGIVANTKDFGWRSFVTIDGN